MSLVNSLAVEALQLRYYGVLGGGEKAFATQLDTMELAPDGASKAQFVSLVASRYDLTTKQDLLDLVAQKYQVKSSIDLKRTSKEAEAAMLFDALSSPQRVDLLKTVLDKIVHDTLNLRMLLYSTKYAVPMLRTLSESTNAVAKFLALEALGDASAWSGDAPLSVRNEFVRRRALGKFDVGLNATYLVILARVCVKYDANIPAPPSDAEMVAVMHDHFDRNSNASAELRKLIQLTAGGGDRAALLQAALKGPKAEIFKAVGFSSKTEGSQWIVEVVQGSKTTFTVNDLKRLIGLGLVSESNRAWFSQLEQEKHAHGFLALLRVAQSATFVAQLADSQAASLSSSTSATSVSSVASAPTTDSGETSKQLVAPRQSSFIFSANSSPKSKPSITSETAASPSSSLRSSASMVDSELATTPTTVPIQTGTIKSANSNIEMLAPQQSSSTNSRIQNVLMPAGTTLSSESISAVHQTESNISNDENTNDTKRTTRSITPNSTQPAALPSLAPVTFGDTTLNSNTITFNSKIPSTLSFASSAAPSLSPSSSTGLIIKPLAFDPSTTAIASAATSFAPMPPNKPFVFGITDKLNRSSTLTPSTTTTTTTSTSVSPIATTISTSSSISTTMTTSIPLSLALKSTLIVAPVADVGNDSCVNIADADGEVPVDGETSIMEITLESLR